MFLEELEWENGPTSFFFRIKDKTHSKKGSSKQSQLCVPEKQRTWSHSLGGASKQEDISHHQRWLRETQNKLINRLTKYTGCQYQAITINVFHSTVQFIKCLQIYSNLVEQVCNCMHEKLRQHGKFKTFMDYRVSSSSA